MFLKRHLLIALFFAGISFLAVYWALFNANTHTGGTWTTDYYGFNWNYWWIRHALATPGLNVYETNFIFFPETTNLAYHTLTAFWFPLWALLEPFTGTLLAVNLIMVTALALAGYFFYLLLVRENVPPALALPFAIIFPLTPAIMMAYNLTTINYVTLFWFPLILLTWGNIARALTPTINARRAILWAVIIGACLYGMMMTDYQHALFFAFLIIPYGLLTLVEARRWRARLGLVICGGLALIVALALLWFVGPLRYLLEFDMGELSPMPIEDAHGIPFPLGYFWRISPYDRIITLGSVVVPGTILSIVASFTFLRRVRDRRRWFWLLVALPPLLVSTDATINVFGVDVTMPYIVVHDLFNGLFRSPSRFGAVVVIPALIFIGRTWGAAVPRKRAGRLAVAVPLLLLLMLENRLFMPMPIQPITTQYEFYKRIGEERGGLYDTYGIVEVPNAGGTGEAWVGEFKPMELEFNGIIHGKRMLNGSIARAPLDYFWDWLWDDDMLAWLGQRRYLEPESVERQLRERIYEWPIGYIIIHQDLVGRFGPTNQEIIGYFNTLPGLLCPVYVEKDAVAYRTAWHPDGCPPRTPPEIEPGTYLIDIGTTGDERFIGWGWHWQEQIFDISLRWTGEYPQTRTYLDLPPGAYMLTLNAQAFWEDRQLRVLVNDVPLGDPITVTTDVLHHYRFTIPADAVGDGKHITVTLDYDDVVIPVEVGQSPDERKLAIAVDWMQFSHE